MDLAELVRASTTVAATPARSLKVAILADLLRRLEPSEVEAAVAMLTGVPRQGRIGVGWRSLQELDVAPAGEPSMVLADLDAAIDSLAACAGPGSGAERTRLLATIMGRATADEQSFIRRLLTGELRQGALEGVMLEAVANASGVASATVRRAAMLGGNIPATAALALSQGAVGLSAVGLQVGRPILPMLAATSPDVATALTEVGTASVEWKLDGARAQVHRSGADVSIFTRSLNDVTGHLPAIVAGALAMPANAFVLDGEAIGLDEQDRPGAFQETMSTFSRHVVVAGGNHGAAGSLAARFFDVLHLDGEDLLDRPLVERLDALDSVVGPFAVPRVVTEDAELAQRFANASLAAGHEGVMVKAASSAYEAGRRGKAWRKVKPVRTLDLVVIAVEWGSGRRRGWLSNLHLGALDPEAGGFVMVGKTFKGLTDQLLTWQTAELLARKVAEHGHVVEVRPELVVEIALDGAQSSTRYPGGVALRFARVRRYRPDKSPTDADTIESVRAMRPAPG
ncbi:MAG: ATP-dependent DNA ligase [Acidimicrobiales bacterium]